MKNNGKKKRIILAALCIFFALALLGTGIWFIFRPQIIRIDSKVQASLDLAVVNHNLHGHNPGTYIAVEYEYYRVVNSRNAITVYANVMYMEYDGRLGEQRGNRIPTIIRLDSLEEDGEGHYTLQEYWEPRDGEDYAKDIRSKFPVWLWKKVEGVDGKQMEAKCLEKAKSFFAEHGASYLDENSSAIYYNDARLP